MCTEAWGASLKRGLVMVFISTALLVGGNARTAELETLLMPGKVTSAHAKYESTCSSCHDRANRKRQRVLCLDCHKDVARDVRETRGFHGRLPNIATGQCVACHSEHLGRDADITKLDPASFDHQHTDFPLEGAHRSLPCATCHQAGKPFRVVASTCGTCHRDDDVHQRLLGEKCGSCHTSLTWTGGRLDHDKTSFPLRDAHRQVSCDACHFGPKYDGTPTTCIGCHMPDDIHLGSRGNECGSCHSVVDWKTAKFDHAKETGFALLGSHAALTCAACHKSGNLEDELPRDCYGCHAADDSHALRLGEKCADCHGNNVWDPADFDHDAGTKFPLVGAHADIDCHACHTATVSSQKLGSDCVSCHRAEDAHGGAIKASCDSCHGVAKWNADLHFDHDLTDFPLLGMHVIVSCAQCHVSKAFVGSPRECVGCHSVADVHKGALGRDCAACHSSNSWQVWEFDHTKTEFPLTGAHTRATCSACHKQPAGQVRLPTDCGSCHREDDIHLGQYGAQCQRCHTTITFKGARIQ
jgi:hypothetical protein